ncbi:S1 family peptidase [Herbiconiux sp. CPCC 205716]|uniref:S1 family peptidase n=1 Tax=Herbiconiux gentiana TaxID=2970912 RepID=A0ABT2GEC3_9MICO|nr:S1 family peptidase [Herbiconiux gentiana]MCS5714537.1 S1 family peptidase [Herbiconiux gentiana]
MTMKKRLAYLAVGTVAIAGMTGAFGQVAFAAGDDEVVPTSGPAFDAYAQSLLTDENIQAVAAGANGPVVYTTEPVAEIGADARFLVESKSNVEVKVLSAPLQAYDTDEVVGGAGYFATSSPSATSGGLCSVGFSGWSPEGDPAVISAGHCTGDNALTFSQLTLPTGDPAGGGADDNSDFQPIAELGELSFSQFGGAGNSTGAQGDTKSVDISVIDVTNDALKLRPEVTDWTTADSEDLAASTFDIDSVGSATVGASIVKSGRTTGYTSGTVDSVNGWANIRNDEGEDRLVYGFGALLTAAPGDSGGALVQGNTAVGVLSGGGTVDGQDFVWGANLEAGLALTGGYTVALHLDAPALTSPADGGDVYTGRAISGTAPAGSTVIATQGSGEPFEVAVNDGTWSFPAPGTVGEYSYTVRAERGFDTSASSTFSVNVVPAPLEPAVISSPFDGQVVETSVPVISGKGEPGATLTLSGDVEKTLTVPQNGTWSTDVDLSYGSYSVTAVQTRENASSSAPTTVKFSVVPVAPAITDPKSGLGYDLGSGPVAVSGTGIDGATVKLTINGNEAGSAVVKNGTWKIALSKQLDAGTVTITATQTIDGATSAVATSTITVTPVDNGGTTPTPAPAPAGNGGNGSLANTGAPIAPLAGGGIALLLAAGGMLLVARRTNKARRAE